MTVSTSAFSSSSSSSLSMIVSTSVTDSAVKRLTMRALLLVVWSVFWQMACVAAFGIDGEKLTVTRAELWTVGQSAQGVGVVLVGVEDASGLGMHAIPVSLNNFTVEDGRVACLQFGFPVASPEVFQGTYLSGSPGLVELSCAGTESSLLQCGAVFRSCCPPAAVNCTEPATTTSTTTAATLQTSTLQSSTSETSTSDATDSKPEVPVYIPIVVAILGLVAVVTIGFILYKVCSNNKRTSASPHQP